METVVLPAYIDVFLSVVRDNQPAQVALCCVFVLILCDWLFGIINAIQHQEFSSTKMREGLYHKAAEVGLLFVGVMVDGALLGGFDFGYSAPVFTTVCVYICAMEVGSLLEIFAKMNPDLQNSPIFAALDSVKLNAESEDDAA